MTKLDLAPNREFVDALTQLPVITRPNGVFYIEAGGNTGRVLAAVRRCKLDDWKERMQVFTPPGFIEVEFDEAPKICLLAATVGQRAGLPSPPPARYAYCRRTRRGYVFLWQSGLDFFLAMNPRGSRYSYNRFWLGITDFPPNRRDKKFML